MDSPLARTNARFALLKQAVANVETLSAQSPQWRQGAEEIAYYMLLSAADALAYELAQQAALGGIPEQYQLAQLAQQPLDHLPSTPLTLLQSYQQGALAQAYQGWQQCRWTVESMGQAQAFAAVSVSGNEGLPGPGVLMQALFTLRDQLLQQAQEW